MRWGGGVGGGRGRKGGCGSEAMAGRVTQKIRPLVKKLILL